MPRLLTSIGSFAVVLGTTANLVLAAVPSPAAAEECPGHPDALGTSRILALDPASLSRVGVMQYPQSLPLADKEVVLTFDDGPLPRYTNPVLDILAAQCVKATFFLVGEMAREFPAVVRRIHDDGHSIGTHTENHPSHMDRLPIDKVRAEIDRGIADVSAALWDAKDLAPFFRIPGLNRSPAIEDEAAARGLIVFSSDTVADDWHRRIRPADIASRAMSRLEARGKGILLLHDIHAATLAALPDLFKKLKEAGFHVVHVVPATPDQIAVARARAQEIAADSAHALPSEPPREAAINAAHELAEDPPREPMSDQPYKVASDPPREAADQLPLDRNEPDWPMPTALSAAEDIELPAPDENAFATAFRPWRTVILADGAETAAYLALDAVTQWADPPAIVLSPDAPQLPVPAMESYFGGGDAASSATEQ
jgi:peptidoglycan/xylan/chitin deacetylase (PgdA/CDA1 family)